MTAEPSASHETPGVEVTGANLHSPAADDRALVKKAKQTLDGLGEINTHIQSMWWKLLRTPEHLYLGGAEDSKIDKGRVQNIYIANTENRENVRQRLAQAKERVNAVLEKVNGLRGIIAVGTENEAQKDAIINHFEDDLDKSLAWTILDRKIATPEDFSSVSPRLLPKRGDPFDPEVKEHGLLYIPHAYVVPGTRFNEMYGWDSAFVVRGLLQSEKFGLAKDIVDGMLYQIEHYGTLLNGNRTYYYDTNKPRSQPPLTVGKILNVFLNYDRIDPPAPEEKFAWLEHAAEMAVQYHDHWMTEPHYDKATNLSRYDSLLGTPSSEVTESEPDHYPEALKRLQRLHKIYKDKPYDKETALPEERQDRYNLTRFYDAENDKLSAEYYKGDRAMRESGFDPSERFGFLNADAASYFPVCLNSLRFKHEQGLAQIYGELAKHFEGDAKGAEYQEKKEIWEGKAKDTEAAIQNYLWDAGDEGRGGAFHDRFNREADRKEYDLPQFRDYNYASAFFPMWVGIASQEQANSIMEHIYPKLVDENMHGLFTSDRQTGCQWDFPMIWPPLVVVAVEAMERYGFHKQALQVGTGFLNTVKREYDSSKAKTGTGKMREKYEGLTGTADTGQFVDMGYNDNCEGFGWTNSAVVEVEAAVKRLRKKLLGKEADVDEDVTILRPVDESHVAAATGRGAGEERGGR